ncbi:extracellular solute-binding protein [Halostagnicola kamekurae]|uniref:ABC-type glycerol-3-phosphate transport system, substrate-binding protein n=1 Tax=Halostagnicola kamekurae TaxID=619731 RepID=A0A1I6QY02_9EURY|nr:extracellular solute-binding protein [Halostagnicola kamekurae]SFS57359.1 ABC-type glycerol-3-phosphate transport system, substrate-binding protein [Halostagnicola kamekurae]
MASKPTPDRSARGISRRTFVKVASASAGAAGVAVAGCLGRAREPGTIVMSGDTDFESIMHTEGDAPSVQQALWDAGLDEDITVEVQAGVDDSAQRMQSYQSALQAGRSPPDIFMMDSGWTIPFILREQTTPLEEALAPEVLARVEDEYLEAALETARDPRTDVLHALPLFPDFGLMLYRQDLMADAGYETDGWATEPPSWREFSEATADARDESGIDFGFTTQAAAYEGLSCCTFTEEMSTWGGGYFGGTENLFTAGDRPITVESEPVIDAIRMMRTFIRGADDEYALEGYRQICPSAIVQWTEEQSLSPFANGDAVAHRNWPFAVSQTGAEGAFGDDLGVMSMPYAVSEDEAEFEGVGGTAAGLGGWHLTLNPHSDRLERAADVLEAFTSENVMLTIFEQLGYLPPVLELLEQASADQIGPVARYTEQIRMAGENAVPRPVTDLWPEQSALIAQEVNAAYRAVKPPDEAMSDLAERLEASEASVEGQNGD